MRLRRRPGGVARLSAVALAAPAALGAALASAACATTPTPPSAAEPPAFQPVRHLEPGGRATPSIARRCRPGMAPAFAPEDADYVAVTWRATSEFLNFVATVMPRLLDYAEARADQQDREHRYVAAAELAGPDAELGGVIELRRRRTRGEVLVREKAFTDDLWMRDGATGSVVYFDGRIDYVARPSSGPDDDDDAGVRVRGWAEVHRPGPSGRSYSVGAEVDLTLKATDEPERVAVAGVIDAACARQIEVAGQIRVGAAHPAGMVHRVALQQRARSLLLEQDGAPEDGCLQVSVDGGAPTRACPEAWAPESTATRFTRDEEPGAAPRSSD